jgi:hypothetical protein
MGTTTVGRFAFEPGWRWSECVKPVAGTESCQARHVGVVHSGRLAIRHNDGTELDIGAGEAYVIEPGHDAWVVGDQGFVAFEFEFASGRGLRQGLSQCPRVQGAKPHTRIVDPHHRTPAPNCPLSSLRIARAAALARPYYRVGDTLEGRL